MHSRKRSSARATVDKLIVKPATRATPANEAITRMGVSKGRFPLYTDYVDISADQPVPQETEQAGRAWSPLFRAVMDELVSRGTPIDPEVLDVMEAAHADAVAGVLAFDNPRVSAANSRLYDAAVHLSENPFVIKAIDSVVHALRLGMMSLPSSIDLALLLRAQRMTIDAIREQDSSIVDELFLTLGNISFPKD